MEHALHYNPLQYLLPKNFYYTKTKIQYYKNKFFY